jgi:hypothetical protein
MRPHYVIPLALLSLAFGNSARAAVEISLSSQDPLMNIAPGTSVTIDVLVQASAFVPPITDLVARIEFESSLMGAPIAIVPDPLFQAGFTGEADPGVAAGIYSGDPILLPMPPPPLPPPLFFSFDVVAQNQTGAGEFAIVFVQADSDEGTIVVGSGIPLEYSVGAGNAVVPEPASLIVWMALALVGLCGMRFRRR